MTKTKKIVMITLAAVFAAAVIATGALLYINRIQIRLKRRWDYSVPFVTKLQYSTSDTGFRGDGAYYFVYNADGIAFDSDDYKEDKQIKSDIQKDIKTFLSDKISEEYKVDWSHDVVVMKQTNGKFDFMYAIYDKDVKRLVILDVHI